MIDNNANTAQIVSGAGELYQMWHSGAIWRYTGSPCSGSNCPGWELLDNNAATIEIVASGSSLYQRHKSGAVWQYTGTPCSGNSCPGWQMIANDPRTIQLVIGNRASLYMFQQSGAIWKYEGTPCNSTGCPGWRLVDFDNANTKQVVAGSENLYRLYPYSDTSRAYVPITRIYEHIKGCFPRRWRLQHRDSTRAILGNVPKCRCRVIRMVESGITQESAKVGNSWITTRILLRSVLR
jgi:hypothetical protein